MIKEFTGKAFEGGLFAPRNLCNIWLQRGFWGGFYLGHFGGSKLVAPDLITTPVYNNVSPNGSELVQSLWIFVPYDWY